MTSTSKKPATRILAVVAIAIGLLAACSLEPDAEPETVGAVPSTTEAPSESTASPTTLEMVAAATPTTAVSTSTTRQPPGNSMDVGKRIAAAIHAECGKAGDALLLESCRDASMLNQCQRLAPDGTMLGDLMASDMGFCLTTASTELHLSDGTCEEGQSGCLTRAIRLTDERLSRMGFGW